MQRHTPKTPIGSPSVGVAVRASRCGELDSSGFIEAVIAVPPVPQAKKPDRDWWDDWAQTYGPMFDLIAAGRNGLIPIVL